MIWYFLLQDFLFFGRRKTRPMVSLFRETVFLERKTNGDIFFRQRGTGSWSFYSYFYVLWSIPWFGADYFNGGSILQDIPEGRFQLGAWPVDACTGGEFHYAPLSCFCRLADS